ncbi:spinster family MFS transporter [Kordiimonas pumila]|uniref:Spinster family MFS transporter n=1 Tax=Kordiimonas pumila TaxID=2161677 RepID=A0ABV7DAE5_9PROT|nr:MFS transporter [Kordiimonas pumila]
MRHIRRHAILLIITLMIIIHAIDRLAIVILLEDIKHDLDLSDAQLGFLSGFAFVALYVLAGIPMAYLSDRSNRSKLIGSALMVIGGMTMLCGMAQNFVQLAFARCGLGISASPCVPAAHSIIADIYPPSQRTTALSITECGFFVGSFIGLWVCGWIATDYGWRAAFIAVGILPILLSFVVFTFMRDPVRTTKSQKEIKLGFKESLGTIIGVPAVRWYVVGSSLAVFALAAMMTWLPTLMIRSYDMTRTEAGGLIGAINGVGGLVVTILVGVMADRLARRDNRWNLWIPASLFALSAPFAALTFLSDTPTSILIYFAISASLVPACSAPIISYSQQIMPSNVHAMITALIFLMLNIVGFGAGPLIVGAFSDFLTPIVGQQEALQQALLYLAAPALFVGGCFVAVGSYLSVNTKAAGAVTQAG